jgi:hypothetical protein
LIDVVHRIDVVAVWPRTSSVGFAAWPSVHIGDWMSVIDPLVARGTKGLLTARRAG